LVLYGSTIVLGQFVLLFSGMYVGMPAVVASLVLQAQAFFTLFFSRFALGERLRGQNLVGLAIAAVGLVAMDVQGGRG
ncbi:O-acetylserine/cysteine exporter, partial [Burkholderia pseudomallei]